MIQIRDDFERSSISVALSFVSGSGDGAIITLTPRLQKSNDVAGGESRWLEPAALVTGVAGTRPTFRFNRMLNNSASTEGGYHYAPWQATRRCMFSEDNGKTWRYFADTSVNEGRGWVEFRHSLPFASDSIRIARARQMSVHQVGEWLESIASPIVIPTPTAAMFVPTAAVAGFAGQAFIANEYKAQHDELGRVIPVTPLYAFEVNDTTLMPASGRKRIGVVISGLHAGEDHAQFVVQQFVAALLGNTPDALAMRREFRVIFLPLVNSPGRAGGGWRGVFDLGPSGEDDPNRHFNQLGVLEVVDKPRAALAYDTSGALPDWVIDMHSAGDQNFGLEYGNPMQMDFHRIVQDIMGRPVDRNAPTFNGQCSNWFQNRGVPLTVTSEVGDVSPASDDSIRSFGAGMMGGVAQLRAGAVAAPVPAPAPAPAPIPPIIRPITVTRATNPPSSKYDGSALDNMGAMTILAYVRPTGRGGGATGLSYIWSKMTANGQPRRLMVDHNGGVPRLSFGLASTSSLAQWGPNASSGPGTVAYGQWALLGATHDGRLRDTSIGLIVNTPVTSAEYSGGSGALASDAGAPMVLLDREDLSRPFVGDFGGFGLWNRVLSPSEIDAVRVGGPQAVPSGLVVFEDWVPATAPIPPTPTVPVSIDLNLGSATFAGTATINADGSWDATLKARGTWR